MSDEAPAHTIRFVGPAASILTATERYLDVEGAYRSGKTTACLWRIYRYATEHPGIKILIARATDDSTQTLLKPLFAAILTETGTLHRWRGDIEAWEILATDPATGTRGEALVYCHGLRSMDTANPYRKLRGKTLAVIYVDKAEELEDGWWTELVSRLSQQGQPHQLILSPNPPQYDHWIAMQFPEENNKRGYRLIRVSTYDNAHNLPPEYIRQQEENYPVGHARRGPLLLGLRGMNVEGVPVYRGLFWRHLHVGPVVLEPYRPLVQAWDFGLHHPCVIWCQFVPGIL